MRILLTAILVLLVLVENSRSEEYDDQDYSNQENADVSSPVAAAGSESNEVDDNGNDNDNDNNSGVTETTETMKTAEDKTTTVRNERETTKKMKHSDETNATVAGVSEVRAHPPFQLDCKEKLFHGEKSEENKCTSTLVNYPFSVSVQKKGAHYATGALLDKRWILTVAGEFYNVRESIKLFRARLGSVDCKKGGTLVPLKRVEIHPAYVYGAPNFDLALLRMAQPVDYTDYIRPIALSNIISQVLSAKFMTTYWPRLIIKNRILPSFAKERIKQNSMRVSTQRLIPREECVVQAHIRNVTLKESSMCLKPVVTHHSICMPDAGAPVVAEDGLWGITSGWVSDSCLVHPSPTIFCRLSSPIVRSWLDTQMLTI